MSDIKRIGSWEDYEIPEGYDGKILVIKILKSGYTSKKSSYRIESLIRKGWQFVFPVEDMLNLKPGFYEVLLHIPSFMLSRTRKDKSDGLNLHSFLE